MINVIASVKVKEGQAAKFIEVFKTNVPNVLAEQGCIEYAPTQDVPTGIAVQEIDPQVVTIIEKWESLEALQAHLTAPHMQENREKTKDLVESVSLKVLQEA